jgi:hypothetical protein
MSGGTIKGLEVLLIAGGVFWFAYVQIKALKQPTPGTEKPGSEREGEAAVKAEGGEKVRDRR